MWDAQVALLAPRFSVLAPDLPGFGASREARGWRFADVAGSLLRIAEGEGLETFGVVGLSMGVYTAFEICRQAPGRLRALVLANGRARADNEAERQSRTSLIARISAEGTGILAEVMLPRLLRPDPQLEVAARVRKMMARATPRAVILGLEALRERADSTDLLATIPCPTLVLAGESDPLTPAAEGEAMAAAIPGARFVTIPGAGHLSNLEQPDAFNLSIEAFLEEAFEAFDARSGSTPSGSENEQNFDGRRVGFDDKPPRTDVGIENL